MSSIEKFLERFITEGGYKLTLEGLSNTVIIAVFGLLIGFILGSVVSIIKIIPGNNIFVKILQKIGDVYVAIFRGTPIVVQLLLLHYALFPAMGIRINSVVEASIIFGINSGAYMSEIMRSGINAVDGGQMEAGLSLGMKFTPVMIKIILPQAIKNILPTLGNEFITLIKETAVVSFIAVTDLTRSFKAIAESTYEYFVPYIMLALTYLVIVLIITAIIKLIERRLAKSDRQS